jgi:hypothetical protein
MELILHIANTKMTHVIAVYSNTEAYVARDWKQILSTQFAIPYYHVFFEVIICLFQDN